MSAKTEQFLGLYKTYEGLVRAELEDPKATRDAMAPPDADKMRMVRQFRNFLAHTDAPGFLEPTEKPAFVRPDTLMPEIDPDRLTLCTQDGTPAGKLLGTVIF